MHQTTYVLLTLPCIVQNLLWKVVQRFQGRNRVSSCQLDKYHSENDLAYFAIFLNQTMLHELYVMRLTFTSLYTSTIVVSVSSALV